MMKLTEAEETAFRLIRGGLLVSRIPEKSIPDPLGGAEPGMRVYRGLIKKGLVFETEEEPVYFDDGDRFDPTPMIEFTEEGEALYAEIFGSPSAAFKL
ncbi:hypothetical protein [Salipiger sp. PrR003]|uniref:hypothetical protein n=1 Tax=Salipiger sp. PrR003 TaxID=2706776 RepID=UPI0013DBB207|nr:hypothetical protein [Salipiger sp. PrR003]NDV51541.1 hypothetical protein [Salipiger sp. PrR003]